MSKEHRYRFSIDTGGTFTDIVVLDEETGEFNIEKSSTTPGKLMDGVINAIEKAKIDLSKVENFFVQGSTTAINTVIQRVGVKTAYLTTKGFRDVPEIARFNRAQPFNMKYHKPPQLVRRRLRFEVVERMNWLGQVITPLDTDSVREVAKKLKEMGVESVAICFLHSFRNDKHEKEARDIINKECPDISVSLSSDMAREHREYERGMTTIIDAYIKPIVATWWQEMEKELRSRGLKGEVIVIRSDGGGMTIERAKDSPINTLMSGPAGGLIGGLTISRELDFPDIITMDMGGTSFDCSMIRDGTIRTSPQTMVHGYSVMIPNLDIHAVGAGGGSIAWVDKADALHVGPQSAGAEPGPMSYNAGGTDPTVTDALVYSGYIDPDYFLGGDMKLYPDLARDGISKLGDKLGMGVDETASGILKVSLNNMAGSIRELAARDGDDPRDFALLCYGGAGSLFGNPLINELEMSTAIIPVAPANFSAWGMLQVDLRYDLSQTVHGRLLDNIDIHAINKQYSQMIKEGIDIFKSEGMQEDKIYCKKTMDLRYAGQEHTVDSVPLDFEITEKDGRSMIYDAFSDTYKKAFGYALDHPAEVITLRVACFGEVRKPKKYTINAGSKDASAAIKGKRDVFSFSDGNMVEHTVYDRDKLVAGNILEGPALIEERTTVANLLSGYKCEVEESGHMIITRK